MFLKFLKCVFSIVFRQVRCSAAEQFLLIVKFSRSAEPLLSTISLMFSVLNDNVLKFAQNSYEYFHVSFYNINISLHKIFILFYILGFNLPIKLC